MKPIEDLDKLAAALGESDVVMGPDASSSGALIGWLEVMAGRNASDLLLFAGEPPTFRIDGRVVRSSAPVLDGDDIAALVIPEIAPHAQHQFREHGIADAALKVSGLGRFRVNLHRERGRPAAAIRRLPASVPGLASLNLPSGAAVLTRIAPDFPTALRSALRQAPDVLVIGEMRDPETMRIALAAGETGHLVLSTLHTTDVTSTIARMTDSFPAERQPTIRQEIAAALAAVFVQTLVPGAGGRVPAAELLMIQYGARQHIRRNALQHLHQEITITRKNGSFTIEECLAKLVAKGVVERSEAVLRVSHPEEFESALRS